MKTIQWKFKLGDFVTPIVHHGSDHATKMVVIAQVTAEYTEYTERAYICAHYRLGDYIRQQISEAELESFKR